MSERRMGVLRRMDATGIPNLLARLLLGGVFLYMGYSKLDDPIGFLKLIREYDLFPPESYFLMNLVAVSLPWLEIFCGILLIVGIAIRGTALLIAGLMVSFTTVVFLRALNIHDTEGTPFCAIVFDCGCGPGAVNICWKLVENTGLTLLSLVLLWSRTTLWLPNILAPKRTSVA